MRGTHNPEPEPSQPDGIIPAYAGNTFGDSYTLPDTGDHPRVCGEHFSSVLKPRSIRGSSPRMRGTRDQPATERPLPGIIPAYAGNTMRVYVTGAGSEDHPRVCGEHPVIQRILETIAGSSPRMRGTPWMPLPLWPCRGIIPAYAGNTCGFSTRFSNHWDHPRVCGEHYRIVRIVAVILGSSPRMRGTHPIGRAETRPVGDHPRVCGEHRFAHGRTRLNSGSSPRMRGTRDDTVVDYPGPGIIPAYAGNTLRD